MAKAKTKIDKRFEKLVQDRSVFPTLETKNSDRLDFAEVSKWTLLYLMEEAYKLGKEDGKAEFRAMF